MGECTTVNVVQLSYNGLDCLLSDNQTSGGTGGVVQYQCTAGVGDVLRRTSVIYPADVGGRQISYEYGGEGDIGDVLNRVQSVHDDDLTVLADYRYAGAAMPVVTLLPQPTVERRWKKLAGQPNGDGGDPYTGYDRFGRVEQMQWLKNLGSGNYTDLVNVRWGYNRASLKTWRQDLLAPASAKQDQHFGYDNLYQVTERQRGLLNVSDTAIGGVPAQVEEFNYDETGNWLRYRQANAGELDIDETRVNNRSNQITQVNGSSSGVGYDANGNMVRVPAGEGLGGVSRAMKWDAWNRLVEVRDEDDEVVAQYQYDGRTRRIKAVVEEETRRFYYNDDWRCVQERVGSSTSGLREYIWQPGNRWELVCRDEFDGSGSLVQRLYCMKDDFDAVAICSAGGEAVERYGYPAFGVTTVLGPAYQKIAESDYEWTWLFHSEFQDEPTGWYNYGYRFQVPSLGRWLSMDPIGIKGGLNLYAFVGNDPINTNDINGLAPCENSSHIGNSQFIALFAASGITAPVIPFPIAVPTKATLFAFASNWLTEVSRKWMGGVSGLIRAMAVPTTRLVVEIRVLSIYRCCVACPSKGVKWDAWNQLELDQVSGSGMGEIGQYYKLPDDYRNALVDEANAMKKARKKLTEICRTP